MGEKVAVVTGASRGIGKACAISLANAGYRTALLARTLHAGERREHSEHVGVSDTSPLPGSLDETAAEIQALGGEAMPVFADSLDYETLVAAIDDVASRWGRIDVLVNNARYVGPGHMDSLLETPIEYFEQALRGYCLSALVLIRQAVPWMVVAGGGRIMNLTSVAAYATIKKPPGRGGWGLTYGIGKAALHRVAGSLAVELADERILAFTVNPGLVVTERKLEDPSLLRGRRAAPADVIGEVVAWLAESPDAAKLNGRHIEAQLLCEELGLVPGWSGPVPNTTEMDFDESPEITRRFEERLRSEG